MPQVPIQVSLSEFDEAVRHMPKMRRAPAGARGSIPVDTLLSADPKGVFVETPIVGTLVQGTSGWSESVSVHARKLIELCDTIKKIRISQNG